MKTHREHSNKTSEKDIEFLISLGDSEIGFAARGEYAEMAGVPAKLIDDLVLNIIYGDD